MRPYCRSRGVRRNRVNVSFRIPPSSIHAVLEPPLARPVGNGGALILRARALFGQLGSSAPSAGGPRRWGGGRNRRAGARRKNDRAEQVGARHRSELAEQTRRRAPRERSGGTNRRAPSERSGGSNPFGARRRVRATRCDGQAAKGGIRTIQTHRKPTQNRIGGAKMRFYPPARRFAGAERTQRRPIDTVRLTAGLSG